MPRCQSVEPRALNIDGLIIIVRRTPRVNVIVSTYEYDLLATSYCPDPSEVIQPRRVCPEVYWLAKAFDEGTP